MQIPPSISCDVECKGGLDGIRKILPSKDLLEERSRTFKALSSPIRLQILALLAIQPMCVCMIKYYVKLADSKLSYHFNVLKTADLITAEQSGNFIIYSATPLGKQMMATLLKLE